MEVHNEPWLEEGEIPSFAADQLGPVEEEPDLVRPILHQTLSRALSLLDDVPRMHPLDSHFNNVQ